RTAVRRGGTTAVRGGDRATRGVCFAAAAAKGGTATAATGGVCCVSTAYYASRRRRVRGSDNEFCGIFAVRIQLGRPARSRKSAGFTTHGSIACLSASVG